MKTLTFISCTLGIGMAVSACGTDPILLGELIAEAEDSSSGDDVPAAFDPPQADDLPIAYPSSSSDEEARAEQILLQYCGECHEAPANAGDLSVIADVDALIARGSIIPGSREDSPIYARMATGSMPPVSYPEQPTSDEIEVIGSYIDGLE